MTEIFEITGADRREELLQALKNDEPFTTQATGGRDIETFEKKYGFVLLRKNRTYPPTNKSLLRVNAVLSIYGLLGRSSLRTGYYTCRQKPEYAQYFEDTGNFNGTWLDTVSRHLEIFCDIDRDVLTFGTPDGVIFYPYSRRYGSEETMIALSEDIATEYLKDDEIKYCMNILINEKMANALELIGDNHDFLKMLNMVCATRGGRFNRAILKLIHRFDEQKNVLLWTDADVFGALKGPTRITVMHGPSKRIRDINVGEKLLTWNHRGDELVETTVTAIKSEWMPREKLMYFKFKNEGHIQTILASKNHPFYTVNRGWTDAEELQIGDEILDARVLLQKEKNKNNIPTGAWKWRDNNPEEYKKQQKELAHRLSKAKPTFTEDLIIELAKENDWPIKFVGNRAFFIEDCNPDFIVENQKKVIEVTTRSGRILKEYRQYRCLVYEKHGYKCLVLSTHERKNQDIRTFFEKQIIQFLTNGAKAIKIVDLAEVPKKYASAYFARLSEYAEFKIENGQMFIKMYDLQCAPYQHYLVEDGMLVHNCDIRAVAFRGSKNLRHATLSQTSRHAFDVGLFPSVAEMLNVPVDIDEKKPMSGDPKTGARKMVEHLKNAGLNPMDLQTFYNDKTYEIEGLHAKFTDKKGKPIGTQIYLVEYLRHMGLNAKPQPPEDDVTLCRELHDALYKTLYNRVYAQLETSINLDVNTNAITEVISNFIAEKTNEIMSFKQDELINLVTCISADETRKKIAEWYFIHPKREIYDIDDIANEMIGNVDIELDDMSDLQTTIDDKISEIVDEITQKLSFVDISDDISIKEFEKIEVVKDYYDMVLRRLGASKKDVLKIREALQRRLDK